MVDQKLKDADPSANVLILQLSPDKSLKEQWPEFCRLDKQKSSKPSKKKKKKPKNNIKVKRLHWEAVPEDQLEVQLPSSQAALRFSHDELFTCVYQADQ